VRGNRSVALDDARERSVLAFDAKRAWGHIEECVVLLLPRQTRGLNGRTDGNPPFRVDHPAGLAAKERAR
jgi:hypothetical protein